jgi:hypothetical protein
MKDRGLDTLVNDLLVRKHESGRAHYFLLIDGTTTGRSGSHYRGGMRRIPLCFTCLPIPDFYKSGI